MTHPDVVFVDHPRPVGQDLVDLVNLPQLGWSGLEREASVVPFLELLFAPVNRATVKDCRLERSLEIEVVDVDQVMAPVSGDRLKHKDGPLKFWQSQLVEIDSF